VRIGANFFSFIQKNNCWHSLLLKVFFKKRPFRSDTIIEELHKKLLHYKDQAPPTSILGKAIHYPLNQWAKLIAYLEDGRIRIDNNDCERA
jgi:transposase